MADQQWPPPSYYTTFDPKAELLERKGRLNTIDAAVLVDDAGRRYMRFQLPESPVKPGSVFLDGYLNDRNGELFTFPPNPKVAGTIDYATGMIVIYLDVSPGPCSRIAEYEKAPPAPPC